MRVALHLSRLLFHSVSELELRFIEAKLFYDEFGFVIFSDVFTADECASTRDAMWSSVEVANPGLQRDDASSWKGFKAAGND